MSQTAGHHPGRKAFKITTPSGLLLGSHPVPLGFDLMNVVRELDHKHDVDDHRKFRCDGVQFSQSKACGRAAR